MVAMNKNKLIDVYSDSPLDGVYGSPAHSDGEPISSKLTQSHNLADILAKSPLDDTEVSRRAVLGITTRNVLD